MEQTSFDFKPEKEGPDMEEVYKNRQEDLENCPRCGNPKPDGARFCSACGGEKQSKR